MSGRPAARTLAALSCALVLCLAAGCSDEPDEDPVARPSAGASATPSASPGPRAAPVDGAAQAYPVAPSASPAPLADLGTRRGSRFDLTLNAVRRTSAQAVVVEATLTASGGNTPLFDLAEPGYAFREVDGERRNTYEFSAVTLRVAGDPLVYQPLRDEQGWCACTWGIQFLDGGTSMGVYTYATAPETADTVTVTVAGFAPFPDVPVTG